MNLAALSPDVRAAAERFERETGRRLDDNLGPGPVDERMVELFLILNGYAPDRAGASVRSRATNRMAVRRPSTMDRLFKALALLAACLLAGPANAADITGTPGKIVDGDTLWVCDQSACHKIRLCGIDAPELSDPRGPAAKRALQKLVGGNVINCVPVGEGTVCDGRSRPYELRPHCRAMLRPWTRPGSGDGERGAGLRLGRVFWRRLQPQRRRS